MLEKVREDEWDVTLQGAQVQSYPINVVRLQYVDRRKHDTVYMIEQSKRLKVVRKKKARII